MTVSGWIVQNTQSLRFVKERYILFPPHQGLLMCPGPALGRIAKCLFVPDHISDHEQASFTIHVPPKNRHVISGFEVDFLEVWISTLCLWSCFMQLPDISIFSYLSFGKKRSFSYLITSGNHVVC